MPRVKMLTIKEKVWKCTFNVFGRRNTIIISVN